MGAPEAITQNVVGLGPVGQDDLKAHCVGVQDIPALILELGVDLDAGEGFVRSCHVVLA